ncbi:hypothetical protein EVAR_80852_1 [Eumeta japonica]|uniref:Uncharacterized protein n=1 Tax=Eumeta variegata TaxID=151549 RepID=A0A4C1V1B5_EUMVA|nr:hypothetical protein EVAR_80852_1 [Eumeta japonica]
MFYKKIRVSLPDHFEQAQHRHHPTSPEPPRHTRRPEGRTAGRRARAADKAATTFCTARPRVPKERNETCTTRPRRRPRTNDVIKIRIKAMSRAQRPRQVLPARQRPRRRPGALTGSTPRRALVEKNIVSLSSATCEGMRRSVGPPPRRWLTGGGAPAHPGIAPTPGARRPPTLVSKAAAAAPPTPCALKRDAPIPEVTALARSK